MNFLGADFHGGSADNSASGAGDGKRKKKSRWATGNDNDKTFIPGMPTILPSTMTPDQQEAYLGRYLILIANLSNTHAILLYLNYKNPNKFRE